jgi:hypothetical protein
MSPTPIATDQNAHALAAASHNVPPYQVREVFADVVGFAFHLE